MSSRGLVRDARTSIRYARRLPSFVRGRVTTEQAREEIARQLAGRADAFLDVLERGVFAVEGSAYRPLFARAGAELGDVRAMVARDGVEGALEALLEAGVTVSLEEFKQRADEFDNPLAIRHFSNTTGGSRTAPRQVGIDLGRVEHDCRHHALFREAFALDDRPFALWRAVPPSGSGFNNAFRQIRCGQAVTRWFNPYRRRRTVQDVQFAVFTAFTLGVAAACRAPLARPELCPADDAARVARWLAARRAEGRPAVLDTQAGLAVRTCLAAEEHGLDISGTTIRTGGEALTAAKTAVTKRAGVQAVTHYSMTELGRVAVACSEPQAADDMHYLLDKLAVLTRPDEGEDGARALIYTTLGTATPKLMINVDSGDRGFVTERECGCPYGKIGMRLHVHGVHARDKLTSEGNQFLAGDLLTLVEEVLPARFGGEPTDYQLVEEEEGGLPRVTIVVRPSVGPLDGAEVVEAALAHLYGIPRLALMAGIWEDGHTLRVVRRDPEPTSRGKILALRPAGV